MEKNQLVKSIYGIVLLTAISFTGFNQVTEAWVRKYGSSTATNRCKAMTSDLAGNVYVTGSTRNIIAENFATIKYNTAGVVQWTAFYNGPAGSGHGVDAAYAIAADVFGNVYVTGISEGIGTGFDMVIIKYNAAGVRQWASRYNQAGTSYDFGHALSVDAAGNVYVLGETGNHYFVAKFNSSGIRQWVTEYTHGHIDDAAEEFVVDGSGNVYVAGECYYTRTDGLRTTKWVTVKFNNLGVVQWEKITTGLGSAEVGDIAMDKLGNIYVTGHATVSGRPDITTIKYNSSGTTLWTQYYGSPGNLYDRGIKLKVDRLGNIYVLGIADNSHDLSLPDIILVKYSSAGSQQWVKGLSDSRTHLRTLSMAVDRNGNVFLSGGAETITDEHSNIFTAKISSSGVLNWQRIYNDPDLNHDDISEGIAVDTSGNTYVAGTSYRDDTRTGTNFVTIKYSPVIVFPFPLSSRPAIGTSVSLKEIPGLFKVSSFPNPVSHTARIQYEIPFDGRVAIKLYDVLGREVSTLVNEQKQAGYHFTEYNASALQKGVYFYKISLMGKEKTEIKSGEMVVVK